MRPSANLREARTIDWEEQMTTKTNGNTVRLVALAVMGALGVSQSAFAYDTAAATAAANSSVCDDVRPFYWEIGGPSGGPIVSGQVGGTDYARDTVVEIASASKWIFGAYVVERYGGIPGGAAGATIVSALDMLEGHVSFVALLCSLTAKVTGCHTIANNDTVDSGKVGYFNYNGGDGQYAAADSGLLGLANKTRVQLLAEMNSYLGLHSDFSYNTPSVASGMKASAGAYAEFLQNIMDGTYEISNYLDYNPVATVCTDCSSPIGDVDMHYTLYHWIEDNAAGTLPNSKTMNAGDGSYSSTGVYGFYPWITSDLNYYGIISTYNDSGVTHLDSAVCGQAIRAAFLD